MHRGKSAKVRWAMCREGGSTWIQQKVMREMSRSFAMIKFSGFLGVQMLEVNTVSSLVTKPGVFFLALVLRS